MDINELKERFGEWKLSNDTLIQLGYSQETETINLWKDLQSRIELRWDRGRNYYYNQDDEYRQRVNVVTINDLIDLYDELGATYDLLNLNWFNLK